MPGSDRGEALVVCYHGVSPTWRSSLTVSPTRLERQVRMLLRRGYEPVTFGSAVAARPGQRLLAITFDDAFRSVYRLARPLLRRLNVPATVFVPTAFAGSEVPSAWPGVQHWSRGPDGNELVPMSWDELRDLQADGWEIGSHTRTHPWLTELDDEALASELALSRRECEEQLGTPCTSLAYPYGIADARVVEAAVAAGYTAATVLAGVTGVAPARAQMVWPRLSFYEKDRWWRARLKLARRRPPDADAA